MPGGGGAWFSGCIHGFLTTCMKAGPRGLHGSPSSAAGRRRRRWVGGVFGGGGVGSETALLVLGAAQCMPGVCKAVRMHHCLIDAGKAGTVCSWLVVCVTCAVHERMLLCARREPGGPRSWGLKLPSRSLQHGPGGPPNLAACPLSWCCQQVRTCMHSVILNLSFGSAEPTEAHMLCRWWAAWAAVPRWYRRQQCCCA